MRAGGKRRLLAKIDSSLSGKNDTADQLERLKEAAQECLNVAEPSPLILNKLIERIEVGSVNVMDEQKQQEIVIIWQLAG